VTPLFNYDFQNYDINTENFAYTCLILEVTKDGILDSIGLWFNLYLDREKTIVVSNSPDSPVTLTSSSSNCSSLSTVSSSHDDVCLSTTTEAKVKFYLCFTYNVFL
jgi:hypothetical protein